MLFNEIPNEIHDKETKCYLGEGTNNNYYLTKEGQCWKCMKFTTSVPGYYSTQYEKVNLTPRIKKLIDSQQWFYNR